MPKSRAEKEPETRLVTVGRVFVILFRAVQATVARFLDNFTSIFKFIQEFQRVPSRPGILASSCSDSSRPSDAQVFSARWASIVNVHPPYGTPQWVTLERPAASADHLSLGEFYRQTTDSGTRSQIASLTAIGVF